MTASRYLAAAVVALFALLAATAVGLLWAASVAHHDEQDGWGCCR